jgi:hypothetical protein
MDTTLHISSTLMDTALRYNAGASAANPALPRVLSATTTVYKLGVLHITIRDQAVSRVVPAW